MSTQTRADYLIIGAGIIGLALARELRSRFPQAAILVIEKEPDVGYHGSGRNSGVLHAGFYYSADSLKARFGMLMVQGEVSGFTRASSGHCYFNLKDGTAQIRCA